MFNMITAPMANNNSQVQNNKEVNKVYQTSNLSIFKDIDGNRVPNLQHVKRLTNSIRVNGMKCNPILVNESMEVIDGQHRLMAAKEAESFVYYIIVKGYTLSEVHTLNLNQKNWSKKDFVDGYATMGVQSYIKLNKFAEKNKDFSLSVCIAFCNNTTDSTHNRKGENKECIEDGTWIGRDFDLAQEWADKIKLIKPLFEHYDSNAFIGTMITLFKNPDFKFKEFLNKLKIQPLLLKNHRTREEFKNQIHKIYNYRRSENDKVNLRGL